MWAHTGDEWLSLLDPIPLEPLTSVNKQMGATTIRKTSSKKQAAKPFLFLSFFSRLVFKYQVRLQTLTELSNLLFQIHFQEQCHVHSALNRNSLEMVMASPERRLSAAPNYLLWLQLSLTKLKLKHLLRARLATLPIKILLSVTLRGRSSEILYRYFIKEEKKKIQRV